MRWGREGGNLRCLDPRQVLYKPLLGAKNEKTKRILTCEVTVFFAYSKRTAFSYLRSLRFFCVKNAGFLHKCDPWPHTTEFSKHAILEHNKPFLFQWSFIDAVSDIHLQHENVLTNWKLQMWELEHKTQWFKTYQNFLYLPASFISKEILAIQRTWSNRPLQERSCQWIGKIPWTLGTSPKASMTGVSNTQLSFSNSMGGNPRRESIPRKDDPIRKIHCTSRKGVWVDTYLNYVHEQKTFRRLFLGKTNFNLDSHPNLTIFPLTISNYIFWQNKLKLLHYLPVSERMISLAELLMFHRFTLEYELD